jgi:hypothetical protein
MRGHAHRTQASAWTVVPLKGRALEQMQQVGGQGLGGVHEGLQEGLCLFVMAGRFAF